MPTVVFEREKGKSGKPVIVVVPEGGALVDTCDDNNAPVPFSCKSASCGTCRIEILEGADELLPPPTKSSTSSISSTWRLPATASRARRR